MKGLLPILFMLLSGMSLAEEVDVSRHTSEELTRQVDQFHERLIQAMQTSDYVSRRDLLVQPVQDFFDVQTIARISLGRAWRDLTPGERQEFGDALGALIVATYADRFDSYAGQRFATLAVDVDKHLVRTQLVRANGEAVQLDYQFRPDAARRNGVDSKIGTSADAGKSAARARVFNVIADGVSDLSLRRADYSSIIKREGFAALVAHLKERVGEAAHMAPGLAPGSIAHDR